jgi:hypothetical protein
MTISRATAASRSTALAESRLATSRWTSRADEDLMTKDELVNW